MEEWTSAENDAGADGDYMSYGERKIICTCLKTADKLLLTMSCVREVRVREERKVDSDLCCRVRPLEGGIVGEGGDVARVDAGYVCVKSESPRIAHRVPARLAMGSSS